MRNFITRTFVTTEVLCLCLDIENEEPFNDKIVIPGRFKSEKEIMKALEKSYNTDKRKAVHIIDHEVKQALYGMSDADFVKHAQKLPNRKTYDKKEV